MAVWNEGERRNRLGDDQVCLLAYGYRSENVADSHRIRRIDRTCVERLLRSKTHTDASEGHHEAHVAARA